MLLDTIIGKLQVRRYKIAKLKVASELQVA